VPNAVAAVVMVIVVDVTVMLVFVGVVAVAPVASGKFVVVALVASKRAVAVPRCSCCRGGSSCSYHESRDSLIAG
jgi:hypothetical protein